jgi:hypothetical protein
LLYALAGLVCNLSICAPKCSLGWQVHTTMLSHWLRWRSHEHFAWAGLEPWSSWSSPLQAWAMETWLLSLLSVT